MTGRTPSSRAGASGRPPVPVWLDVAAHHVGRWLILLTGAAAVLVAAGQLALVTLPVVLAVILATIAVPPARRLERRGLPRLAAALVVVGGGGGLLVTGVSLLVPTFARQVSGLAPAVQAAFDQLISWLETGPLRLDRAELDDLLTGWAGDVGALSGELAARAGSLAIATVELTAALLLAVVLLFFFVKDGEELVGWFIARTPERLRDDVRAAGARGWGALAGYVRGTAAIALIDAAGVAAGLLLLDVPLVLPLTVLVFVGGFVPVVGAFASGLLATLVAFAAGGPGTALATLAVVLVVQQVEGNVLQPAIMRRAVPLHPVVILTALTAGTVAVGLAGAILAVPAAAVASAVGNELRLRGEMRRDGKTPPSHPVGGRRLDPELLLPEPLPAEPDTDTDANAGTDAEAASDISDPERSV